MAISINITNKGIANGKPNPKGIAKNIVISVAILMSIATTI